MTCAYKSEFRFFDPETEPPNKKTQFYVLAWNEIFGRMVNIIIFSLNVNEDESLGKYEK